MTWSWPWKRHWPKRFYISSEERSGTGQGLAMLCRIFRFDGGAVETSSEPKQERSKMEYFTNFLMRVPLDKLAICKEFKTQHFNLLKSLKSGGLCNWELGLKLPTATAPRSFTPPRSERARKHWVKTENFFFGKNFKRDLTLTLSYTVNAGRCFHFAIYCHALPLLGLSFGLLSCGVSISECLANHVGAPCPIGGFWRFGDS